MVVIGLHRIIIDVVVVVSSCFTCGVLIRTIKVVRWVYCKVRNRNCGRTCCSSSSSSVSGIVARFDRRNGVNVRNSVNVRIAHVGLNGRSDSGGGIAGFGVETQCLVF